MLVSQVNRAISQPLQMLRTFTRKKCNAVKNDFMTSLYIGDSHAHSILRALKLSPQQNLKAIDVRFADPDKPKTKDIPNNLRRRFPAKSVYFSLGGMEHNLVGLLEPEEKFDFMEGPEDDVDSTRHIIPHAVIRSALLWRLGSSFIRSEQIRQQFSGSMTYVAPPPPFREVDEDLQLPTAFAPHAGKGIVPARIRMKLYRLRNHLARQHWQSKGVGFLPPPVGAMDEDGFLLRSFWDRDPTHANANYGALVVDQIRKNDNATVASI
jgi:hypothetical protein